jgi:hypothetical protein
MTGSLTAVGESRPYISDGNCGRAIRSNPRNEKAGSRPPLR